LGAVEKEIDNSKKVKIGIIMTYPRLEVKKEEIISYHDKNRPWLKLSPDKFVVERKFRRERKLTTGRHPLGKRGLPTDVATACYIHYAHAGKGVEVDMIQPHEISKERLAENDLNFLMIYDLLESFHTDKSKDKKLYNALKECLDADVNIFPPLAYQELIYSKIKYYNYLKEQNVPIAPTFTMTAEEYKQLGAEKAMVKVFAMLEAEKWPRFICKPVYGQEGIDATFFEPTHKKSLARYFERCMNKYPGIIMQKEIPDFGNSKKSPELRMYYVGSNYQYAVCANDNCIVRPTAEGGSLDTPLDNLKRSSRKILKKLPQIVMKNGKKLPRLLTRLDGLHRRR